MRTVRRESPCPPACAEQVGISTMVLRTHQDKTFPGAMVASLSVPWGTTREEREGDHVVWPRDLVERGALEGSEVADMIRRALSFLVRRGPVSDQDRWEEDSGLNTFTLAVCISALVAGARYLPAAGARALALAFADYWNARLENWTTACDTPLARLHGVPGRMTSMGGMLPEQVWDAAPIAARGLNPGRPTGAAMPLAWAHAEYLKLVVSRALRRPFDRPDSVWEQYRGERPTLTRVIWSQQAPAVELPEGCGLTVALREPGVVHWGLDGWQDVREQDTAANSLGLHVLEIDTSRLCAGRYIDLTFRSGANWIGNDFRILVTTRSRQPG